MLVSKRWKERREGRAKQPGGGGTAHTPSPSDSLDMESGFFLAWKYTDHHRPIYRRLLAGAARLRRFSPRGPHLRPQRPGGGWGGPGRPGREAPGPTLPPVRLHDPCPCALLSLEAPGKESPLPLVLGMRMEGSRSSAAPREESPGRENPPEGRVPLGRSRTSAHPVLSLERGRHGGRGGPAGTCKPPGSSLPLGRRGRVRTGAGARRGSFPALLLGEKWRRWAATPSTRPLPVSRPKAASPPLPLRRGRVGGARTIRRRTHAAGASAPHPLSFRRRGRGGGRGETGSGPRPAPPGLPLETLKNEGLRHSAARSPGGAGSHETPGHGRTPLSQHLFT